MESPTGTLSASVTLAVREVLADELGKPLDAIHLDDSVRDDLGVDSLEMASLQLALEERFTIDIEERDLLELRTVKDLVDHIWKQLPEVTELI
jgi:acyl carrier protein